MSDDKEQLSGSGEGVSPMCELVDDIAGVVTQWHDMVRTSGNTNLEDIETWTIEMEPDLLYEIKGLVDYIPEKGNEVSTRVTLSYVEYETGGEKLVSNEFLGVNGPEGSIADMRNRYIEHKTE